MSYDYKLLGGKIKKARESLLMQPEEVAMELKLTLNEYVSIESGDKNITGDQLVRLANYLRRDFRYFVTIDYKSAEDQIDEMFRQNADLSRNDRIAIQEFTRLCEYESFLEELLDFKSGTFPNYGLYKGKPYYRKQGLKYSIIERDRLKLGRQPIKDIYKLLRMQGIHVFKRTLEDQNISGLYLKHPTAGHCILINYLDDLYRQNFSAAHEYCHALFDSNKQQTVSYWKGYSNGSEWRANTFAGNFLVPEERLIKDYSIVNRYEDWIEQVSSIAKRFFVSSQVVIFRLLDIGWIDKQLKDKLLSDKRLVIRSQEKYDPEIPPELPVGTKNRFSAMVKNGLSWNFMRCCVEAYNRGEITYQKALEMTLLPLEESRLILSQMSLFIEVSE